MSQHKHLENNEKIRHHKMTLLSYRILVAMGKFSPVKPSQVRKDIARLKMAKLLKKEVS